MPSDSAGMIHKDINRTFHSHTLLRTSFGKGCVDSQFSSLCVHASGMQADTLFRILWAHCGADRELGYCSGMSYLAGLLLLQMKEEVKTGSCPLLTSFDVVCLLWYTPLFSFPRTRSGYFSNCFTLPSITCAPSSFTRCLDYGDPCSLLEN